MKDFANGIKVGTGALALLAALVGLLMMSGCPLLDAAAELSGERVYDTCKLPQMARARIKAPIEAEAVQACIDDGQFTAAECASISLSFGCPQDQGVL